MTDRPLVLIVGSDSPRRQELAQSLIDRGRAVVICSGPPGCPLIRGERCVIVGTADAAIVLEPGTPSREIAVGLDLCSIEARRCVVGDPEAGTSVLADRVDAALATS
jgi:hypothetical protein